GLIYVGSNPYVIEYNCRMGDPETEVVFPRMKNQLVDLFEKLSSGQLATVEIESVPETAATVMLTAAGYPEAYRKGDPIRLPETPKGTLLLHAGTQTTGDQVLTNGGRVLAITAFGSTIGEAVGKSLAVAEQVVFEGKYYRRDIGMDLIGQDLVG
ncbi:MAG: phosphoribosylamine--glycine ligase, partial [Saprospiraceae bacterium]|nr:phosphoribosylamine--glycine ligase [Saprospiraceae bacterium]